MVPSSDARMPLARWPQDAPHPDEEYILSLLIERGDYRWALHQSADEAFFPIIFWRTTAFKKEELDECERAMHRPLAKGAVAPHLLLFDHYVPTQVIDVLVAPPREMTDDPTPPPPRYSKAAFHQYRATRRMPAISVHCVFLDADHPEEEEELTERGLRLMLKESFPCHLYRLNLPQILPSTPPHASLVQRLHYKALDYLFPNAAKETLLLIDAGAQGTTLTALGTQPSSCQFLSLRSMLQLLHQHTGKLPDVSSVLDGWTVTPDGVTHWTLPALISTNTADAMVAAVARAHALAVRHALVVWARSVADRPPLTCVVTGVDGDRLLALWNHATIDATNDDELVAVPAEAAAEAATEVPVLQWRVRRRDQSQAPRGAAKRAWNDDDAEEPVPPHALHPDGDAEDRMEVPRADPRDDGIRIAVHRQRHLPFHGLRAIWWDAVQQREATMNAVERWRHDVLGCRIAKSFGAHCFVGAVTYVDWDAQCPDSMDHDLLTIQYDDGDVEDFNLSEFYEHLELFIHTSRDDPDARTQQHRAAAVRIYEQLPTLTTAIEARANEVNGPGDADVALVVQTAMQEASSCSG